MCIWTSSANEIETKVTVFDKMLKWLKIQCLDAWLFLLKETGSPMTF